MGEDQIAALADAGVSQVQPGIESLDDGVLKSMRKGVEAGPPPGHAQHAAEAPHGLIWSILYAFPGEPPEATPEWREAVPAIEHLPPPNCVVRSPPRRPVQPEVSNGRRSWGSRPAPDAGYAALYDVPEDELEDLAISSEGHDPDSARADAECGLGDGFARWRAWYERPAAAPDRGAGKGPACWSKTPVDRSGTADWLDGAGRRPARPASRTRPAGRVAIEGACVRVSPRESAGRRRRRLLLARGLVSRPQGTLACPGRRGRHDRFGDALTVAVHYRSAGLAPAAPERRPARAPQCRSTCRVRVRHGPMSDPTVIPFGDPGRLARRVEPRLAALVLDEGARRNGRPLLLHDFAKLTLVRWACCAGYLGETFRCQLIR